MSAEQTALKFLSSKGKKGSALALALAIVIAVASIWWSHRNGSATTEAATTSGGSGAISASAAKAKLAGIKVATESGMDGYSRARFSAGWDTQSDGCDAREHVLTRDGKNVTKTGKCKLTGGTWVSLYDGKTVTKPSELDIDHLVPLANAWRSGAPSWPQDKRHQFANDLTNPQLVAVSASSNRSKGDQGPDTWKPTEQAEWCAYSTDWIVVKSTYGLTVTKAEHDALDTMLDTCK